MAYSEKELIEIGGRFSTQRLIEQANVSIAMARAHSAELQKKFPPARVDELESIVAEISTKYGIQADAKDSFGTANVPVAVKIAEAKRWISSLITSADNAYEEEPEIRDEFHKSGKIGVSVPKILGRMETLLVVAEKHKDDLLQWGFDEKDLRNGRKIIIELTSANTTQEEAVKVLPATTKELYILKAKAYILLKKLARAARDINRDDPTTAIGFNLSILKRKGRRAGEEEVPAPTPTAGN
jgi:hypothetical protein